MVEQQLRMNGLDIHHIAAILKIRTKEQGRKEGNEKREHSKRETEQ